MKTDWENSGFEERIRRYTNMTGENGTDDEAKAVDYIDWATRNGKELLFNITDEDWLNI